MCSMSSIAKKRLTLFLNPAIIKHARVQAVFEELTLAALVEKAIVQYLPKEIIIKKVESN